MVLTGCSAGSIPENTPLTDTELHALMTESLDLELARLNTLTFDLHRTETELARERRRRAEDIIRTAQRLQESARHIRAMAPDLPLDDYRQARFAALASELAENAENLAERADLDPQGDLERPMQQIRSTCNRCHNLYRDR